MSPLSISPPDCSTSHASSQLNLAPPSSDPADFLTHRPPSPPSLLILLFTLGHPLSASDNLFLASLPPSIALLPVFTKTDLCPLHEIADRKRTLDNAIKAARDSASVAAEERERLRNLAKMSAEFDASQAEEERAKVDAGLQGGWKSDLGAPQGPERPLVKAKTWDGMCVSTKKGWVLRDKVSPRFHRHERALPGLGGAVR